MSGRRPVRAAVLVAPGELRLEEVGLDAPEPAEVRVRLTSVGLCHSDLHYVDGTHATDLPEILGHEATGVVEEVGSLVTTAAVGQRVVTSLTPSCGRCRYCVIGRVTLCSARMTMRERPRPKVVDAAGRPIGTMGGVGAFAEEIVVHQNAVTPVPDAVPSDVAALFGCAVLTGVGAVTRAASVPVGASVAVVGCGGIGLSAVMGAVLAGASRIVAVDLSADKLAAATRFGATDTHLAGEDAELVERVREATDGGVDFSFEAVGRASTVELAYALLAPGGTCTVLGMVPDSTPIHVNGSSLFFEERRLQGAFIGSSRFTVDVPQLATLYLRGRLPLDDLITHRVTLATLDAGLELLTSGRALRVVADLTSR